MSLVCITCFLFSLCLMVMVAAFLPSTVTMIVLKCPELWVNAHILKINIILKGAFQNCLGCFDMSKHLSLIFKVPHQRFGFLQTGGGKPLSGHTHFSALTWDGNLSSPHILSYCTNLITSFLVLPQKSNIISLSFFVLFPFQATGLRIKLVYWI